MEDDRIKDNADQGNISVLKIIGGAIVGLAAIVLWVTFSPSNPPTGNTHTQALPEVVKSQPAKLEPPPETKEQYIASAKLIGDRNDAIYTKAFIKNPDKYKGQRVKITVKIMDIQEKDGETFMNVYLNRDYDVGLVGYQGSTDVYQGDVILVYGEVLGLISGTNRMGAEMTWPGIMAKYVKKVRSENDED